MKFNIFNREKQIKNDITWDELADFAEYNPVMIELLQSIKLKVEWTVSHEFSFIW